MGLCADTVDGNALRHPLVDVVDHTPGHFGIVGNVEVVVVDVELRVGVGGASGAEGDSDEVFAQHAAEYAVSKVAVLGEDLVNYVPLEEITFLFAIVWPLITKLIPRITEADTIVSGEFKMRWRRL